MVTADQFLRRSLLAPIAVPILATISCLTQPAVERDGVLYNGFIAWTDVGLAPYLVVGALGLVPYVWMLCEKRQLLATLSGQSLEREFVLLPLSMVKYAFLTTVVLLIGIGLYSLCMSRGISSLDLVWDWLMPALGMLTIGSFIAVPIVGYLFIIVTYTWLGIFKLLRLIDR